MSLYRPKRDVRGYCCNVSGKVVSKPGSLDDQEKRIRAYAAYEEYQVVKIYKDEGLMDSKNRPGLSLLLSEMQKGDVLVVMDVSNISQDAMIFFNTLHAIQQKSGFVVVESMGLNTTTAAGRLMMNILAAFTEYFYTADQESRAENDAISAVK